jgi:hypothetical protein
VVVLLLLLLLLLVVLLLLLWVLAYSGLCGLQGTDQPRRPLPIAS